MTEAPAVLIFTQHVDEGVLVEPGLPSADADYYAGPEDPLRYLNLPVESSPVEDPCAADAGGAIGEVWVEEYRSLPGAD